MAVQVEKEAVEVPTYAQGGRDNLNNEYYDGQDYQYIEEVVGLFAWSNAGSNATWPSQLDNLGLPCTAHLRQRQDCVQKQHLSSKIPLNWSIQKTQKAQKKSVHMENCRKVAFPQVHTLNKCWTKNAHLCKPHVFVWAAGKQ